MLGQGWPLADLPHLMPQGASWKAEVTEFKMSWLILGLLHKKNMRFLTFCNNVLKGKSCKAT